MVEKKKDMVCIYLGFPNATTPTRFFLEAEDI